MPPTLLLAADLGGSLYLMFGAGEPWARWAGSDSSGRSRSRSSAPVTLVIAAVVISRLTGKPIRWN